MTKPQMISQEEWNTIGRVAANALRKYPPAPSDHESLRCPILKDCQEKQIAEYERLMRYIQARLQKTHPGLMRKSIAKFRAQDYLWSKVEGWHGWKPRELLLIGFGIYSRREEESRAKRAVPVVREVS